MSGLTSCGVNVLMVALVSRRGNSANVVVSAWPGAGCASTRVKTSTASVRCRLSGSGRLGILAWASRYSSACENRTRSFTSGPPNHTRGL